MPRKNYKTYEQFLILIGKYLKNKRKEKGYTQRDIANHLSPKMTSNAISQFEAGKTNNMLLLLAYIKLVLDDDDLKELFSLTLKNNLYGIDFRGD